jgi:hypothetical protein
MIDDGVTDKANRILLRHTPSAIEYLRARLDRRRPRARFVCEFVHQRPAMVIGLSCIVTPKTMTATMPKNQIIAPLRFSFGSEPDIDHLHSAWGSILRPRRRFLIDSIVYRLDCSKFPSEHFQLFMRGAGNLHEKAGVLTSRKRGDEDEQDT